MILIPNCSEIVGYIGVHSIEDVRLAAQDIMDALGGTLCYKSEDYYAVHVNEDGSKTFDLYGYLDDNRIGGWIKENRERLGLESKRFWVKIEPRHLEREEDEIVVNLWEDEFTVLFGPDRSYFDVFAECNQHLMEKVEKVRFKRMDKDIEKELYIGIMSLYWWYDEKKPESDEGYFGVWADQYDPYEYDDMAKFIRKFSDNPELCVRGEDGGDTDNFKEWIKAGQPELLKYIRRYPGEEVE